jgi:hypothetical protein
MSPLGSLLPGPLRRFAVSQAQPAPQES